jgi:quinol monooxygenase YgiN
MVLTRAGERRDQMERLVLRAHVMVRLSIALRAASARSAQELLEAFRFLAVGARLETGCLGCSEWLERDAVVRYVEEWSNETDMRRRVQSERFTSVLAVLESAVEAHVQFDFVTESRGLEYIAEVRGDVVK